MKKILLSLFLIFSTAACIYAQERFQLQFPVKCTINKDCWIVNYVDDDSSANWHDYRGGRETYEGHTGTDIAIKDISKMKQGVEVVAAMGGVIVATRDGMPDKNALAQDTNQLQDIACGNRVAIKHTDGWITDYCHMKKGSVRVKKGDSVMTGQKLGQIGLSGLTEFPHLHINVQRGNQIFDPFTGAQRYNQGSKISLWNAKTLNQLPYKPLVVYNVGVSDEIPKLLDVRDERYKTNQVSSNSNMIIFWIDALHVETGDSFDVSVTNSNGGSFFKQKIVLNKPNAKNLLYTGIKKPANGFKKGNYNVQIFFKRPNSNVNDYRSFKFIVY